MGSVEVSPEGALKKEKVDLNFITQDGNKQVRENGVAGAKQALSEEEESRLNEDAEHVNARERDMRAQSHASVHKRQQQPLGPVVRWERFLSLRSLKVLLVENDDSTRQVVSALLRNCSYEVTAATNGLQAWRILEDSTYHVDLVLTEVVLPCLTGVGLLCKIMSHKTCKNIPVIMMSSHDSMGIVFKCLSRGAVDFLVKPIRKNELKNLWQHVWRRCHSSSGSGSESGIQTRNSPQSKSVDGSDNNNGSNDEDDNASIGLNNRDGSDNGSDTQSSWTKRAVDVDSPKLVSPWDQLTEPRNSICAHVIHPGTETLCSEQLPASKEWGCKDRKELLDNTEMGKDLEIGVLQNRDNVPEQGLVVKEQKYEGALTLENFNNTYSKVQAQPVNLIGSIANNSNVALMEMGPSKTPNGPSKIPEIRDKPIADTKESPFIDLSLKTLRSTGERGISQHDEQNGLRHSVLSAFSRYNTATSAAQALIGCGRNFSFPLDSISEAVKTESVYNFASDSNAALVNHGSYGSSNNDMGSTTKNAFTKPAIVKDSSASTSTAKCVTHSSSAFHPVHQCHNFPTQQVITENTNDMALSATENQLRGGHHQVQVQHHHYHYHHHRHHVHNISLKNMAAVAPQCGSSTEPMEGNGNYNINESASGSNHESNRQNGSSTDVNNGGMNMESDNGAAGKSAAGWGGSSGVDQNHLSQREVALSKFRQKRKERCFEKKVRYQSRKKLAEQRPRMRGQFVRQIVYQHTSEDTDC